MKPLLLSVIFCVAAAARGEEVLQRFTWGGPKDTGKLAGEVIREDDRAVLKLENADDGPRTWSILEIPNPGIQTSHYALQGQVRYESVEGEGYLQTLNHFPPTRSSDSSPAYFSRTLSDHGMMRSLKGTSGWREFALPFRVSMDDARPELIEFELFLPGKGTVYLGEVRLVEFQKGEHGPPMFAGGTGWWSDGAGGLVAGIAGATFGCLASVFALLAARGKARGLVLSGTWGMIVAGMLSAAAGIVALLWRQPYAVWFPLMLMGLLILLILPFRLRDLRRTYEEQELRRMRSVDA